MRAGCCSGRNPDSVSEAGGMAGMPAIGLFQKILSGVYGWGGRILQ